MTGKKKLSVDYVCFENTMFKITKYIDSEEIKNDIDKADNSCDLNDS